ncbi:MAG: ATP-binding protein [Candidatus Krumholzibacteriia bacterium]
MNLQRLIRRMRSGKAWRLRVTLLVLAAATVVLLVVNLIDLVQLYDQYGSWRGFWNARWQLESGIASLVTSGLFHLFILFLGWSIWFRVRHRELEDLRLRRSEQKYRSIINHAGEAIFLLDTDGRVLEWNKAAETLFGAPRRNALNRRFQDIHLCYGIEVERAMADALKHKRSLSFEFPFPRRQCQPGSDGRPGEISLTISPVTGGGGPVELPPTVVVIARDITREKQLESKMSETEKLAGIGQLAAGIAHQLNTPLGSILLSAQMLEDGGLAEDEVEDVRRIIRQTEQCRTIIKGLLNFARPSGSERTVVPLPEVVRETVYLMEKALRVADVKLDIREETEAEVRGNRNELDQVFFNLLANSLDAMPQGGEIRVVFREGSPGEVEVEFRDTGEGIPAESQDKVFLPFFTTKEYGRGTGLGLSIVARIVHEHGGRIEMESRRGEGTAFTLAFPRPVRAAEPRI